MYSQTILGFQSHHSPDLAIAIVLDYWSAVQSMSLYFSVTVIKNIAHTCKKTNKNYTKHIKFNTFVC